MTLSWLINRLKLMSVGEVLYRVRQAASSAFEMYSLRLGSEPLLPTSISNRLNILDTCLVHDSYLAEVKSDTDKLLQGRLSLFEYNDLAIGWPIQWHRDPLTGVESPARQFGKTIDYRDDQQVGDIKVLWELGRQQFLVPIAIDYLCNREQKQLDVIAGVINSWLHQNRYGYGVHWCSSLEVALRGMSWSITHQYLLAAGLPKGIFSLDIDVAVMEKQVFQHAAFIRGHLSLYSSANNHLIGELTGLHILCSVFAFGKKSGQWQSFAWQSLLAESGKQVCSDGVNKEQAIYYHCWVLEYLIINYCIASHNEVAIPEQYALTLTKMAQFVSDLSPMATEPPQIGDADDGVAIRFNVESTAFHRDLIDSVNALAGEHPPSGSKAFWYQAMLKADTVPSPVVVGEINYPKVYPEGGYAILGQPSFHAVFDCGALGYPSIAAHGHADALNLCLAVDGEWWLVDPGTYAYHSDHVWRNYFRGSRGHNVLTVNEGDQSEIGGPFMWVRHAKAHFEDVPQQDGHQRVSGWHDGYISQGVPRVSRNVEVQPDIEQLAISDEVQCATGVDIGINYHFAPDVSCVEVKSNNLLLEKRGSRARIKLEFSASLAVKSYQGDDQALLGWYSSSLGKKEPSLTIQASAKITITTTFTTVLTVEREK